MFSPRKFVRSVREQLRDRSKIKAVLKEHVIGYSDSNHIPKILDLLVERNVNISKFYTYLSKVWEHEIKKHRTTSEIDHFFYDLTYAIQQRFGSQLGNFYKLSKRLTPEEQHQSELEYMKFREQRMRIVGPQVLTGLENIFNEHLAKRNELIQLGVSNDDPRIIAIDADLDYLASQSYKLRQTLDNLGIKKRFSHLKDMN